jgi:hypothetical protein
VVQSCITVSYAWQKGISGCKEEKDVRLAGNLAGSIGQLNWMINTRGLNLASGETTSMPFRTVQKLRQ